MVFFPISIEEEAANVGILCFFPILQGRKKRKNARERKRKGEIKKEKKGCVSPPYGRKSI